MRNRFLRLLTLGLALLPLALLPACGGGGGGSTSAIPAAYTGSTQQAAITSSNAQNLSVGALNGGLDGMGVATTLSTAPAPPAAPSLLLLANQLRTPLEQGLPGQAAPAATSSQTQTGNCGGQATATINASTTSNTFSGTLLFDNFCQDGQTLSGSVPLTGSVDPISSNLQQFAMTLNGLTSSDAAASSESLVGQVTWDISADGLTNTIGMDMVLTKAATGKSYWAHNYRFTLVTDAAASYLDLTASGRFYDADNGYVDFSTPTALHAAATAAGPTSGVILFSGSNGSKARLTVNSDGSYLIEADANGDGTYEWSTTYTPL